jgi:hypothetical protein
MASEGNIIALLTTRFIIQSFGFFASDRKKVHRDTHKDDDNQEKKIFNWLIK